MHLIFDTETTGLPVARATPFDPRQPWILQVGAVLLDEQLQFVDQYATLVKIPPNVEPHPAAVRAHGILGARARAEGIEPAAMHEAFNALVARAQFLWGFNIEFDLKLMLYSAIRARALCPWQKLPPHCVMKMMTPLCAIPGNFPGSTKWPNLTEAHQHAFGQPFTDAHDALADVLATGRLIKWLRDQNHWAPPGPRVGGTGTVEVAGLQPA